MIDTKACASVHLQQDVPGSAGFFRIDLLCRVAGVPLTELEWLDGRNFYARPLRTLARDQHRKWRLFAAACCRRAIPWTGEDERLQPVVEAVEAFADELIGWDEVRGVRRILSAIKKDLGPDCQGPRKTLDLTTRALDNAIAKKPSSALYADETCRYAYRASFDGRSGTKRSDPLEDEKHQQWLLARDIFGNPFRPVAFDPAWRTADSLGIAARMYETRDFAAMPILADALEEAGCTNADVLLHAREPGVHVRGCWVVDGVMGKS